ncbi:MAG TPA: aryl-sulfate sulfotransferase [Ignavibacteria bacterium]|nr:aryl-sulfate sulfotransferase [Ignavibacteria bacterium]HMR00709.1 aryl-sulfate sulfotransferase [Ignavibacteria bacterium]
MKFILSVIFLVSAAVYSNEIVYTDPVNGAEFISIENTIVIGFLRQVNYDDAAGNFSVTGTLSGNHTGMLLLAENGKKIIFQPETPFSLNEVVTVKLNGKLSKFSKAGTKFSEFSFRTTPRVIKFDPVEGLERETGISINRTGIGMLAPPPVLNVTINNSPSAGSLFFAPFSVAAYITILNNNGTAYWSQQRSTSAFDFKKQTNGNLTFFANNPPRFVEMNSSYDTIHTYRCGNGYTTDLHELQILASGNALLMAYDPQPVDMSQIVPGGRPNATVIGLIIQEIDQQNNVLFQWRSWDHMLITDATQEDLTDSLIDYVHGNAIELDNDNNILISSRHIDEITKINRTTGNIMWRLGGKNNMFTILNDTMRFSHQHDIRRIDNGNITFFDNGSFRFPEYSRAVEYSLDEVNHTATLVWQYQRNPQVVSSWGGNVQRLPNGNTFIAWGGAVNTVTEVKPDGTSVFEASYTPGVFTYRGFKDTWPHVPTAIDPVNNTSSEFRLLQNYPNPFNPSTTIRFNLDKAGKTSIVLYNVTGEEVKTYFNGYLETGFHTLTINGSGLASGVYFCRLVSGSNSAVSKMMLVK